MVEDRSVAKQTHEIINLEHPLADAEMKLPKNFLVGHWAKLCPNKKAKTGQAAVNIVVGGSSGASTSGATEGDMGETDVILGIKLIRSTDGIVISQSHYIEKIIEKFGYQNSRIAKTPYDSSVALFKNESGVLVAQLRVLKNLTGMVSLAIHYGKFPVVLEGYSDASWIAKKL
ncbi:UNVERIFIED_CONTAM: hypothetical protein Slati_0507200 [Sesamum latifolium]|uniref:Zinc finger, CCHC-type n=1 Tax=Sesamum latifolium TaxID=2727402 RepID=A0AAW2XXT5_9LAMI